MAKDTTIISLSTSGIAEPRSENGKSRIRPPFGYFGSKNRIALRLCENLPPHNAWVEVFCGSAALTFGKPRAPIEIINDIDGEVVNLFRQLRDHPKRLIELVALTPYSRLELDLARKRMKGLTNLERARRFLVTSMMAINGVFGDEKGGFSFSDSYARNSLEARVSRWYGLPERISNVVERLRQVRIEHRDGLKLFESFVNRPASLVYLDPPYLADRVNGYNRDNNDEVFHTKLLLMAKSAKCMVFISSYDNLLYSGLLSDWATKRIKTTTRDHSGKTHHRTEVVWMNAPFVQALKKGVVPVHLSSFEKKNGRLNPTRGGR